MALSFALGGVVQAQSSCDGGTTKAVGKKVAYKTRVIANAQLRGLAADRVKLIKCETKFASSLHEGAEQGRLH